MTDSPSPRYDLIPASWDDVVPALAYALRYDERGQAWPGAAQIMASYAAERLAEQLEAGFVVLRMKPTKAHSAG
jgi:hypothetical protein